MKSVFLILIGILMAASCGKHEAQSLRIGLLVWPAYELAYLARDLGYYQNANIDLVEYYAPADVVRAYQNGLVDAVAMTLDYYVQIADQSSGHVIALVINVSDGGDALLARADIKNLQGLKDKRIGYEASALGAYMLQRVLHYAQLDESDITIVPVDIPDQPGAYKNQHVDAVITYEPYRSKIVEMGARELFSSKDIPDEIVDILIVRKQTVLSQKADLQAFIDGWFAAHDYLEKHPVDAAKRVAPRENMTAQEFLAALEGIKLLDREENKALLVGSTPKLMQTLRRLNAIMQSQGYVKEVSPYEDAIYPDLVMESAGK